MKQLAGQVAFLLDEPESEAEINQAIQSSLQDVPLFNITSADEKAWHAKLRVRFRNFGQHNSIFKVVFFLQVKTKVT